MMLVRRRYRAIVSAWFSAPSQRALTFYAITGIFHRDRCAAQAGLLGGVESEGSLCVPRRGPGCGRICALPGAGREAAAAPGGQALERCTAWPRRNHRGPCEQHLSRDLHSEGKRGLCVARLSEEGDPRDCDAEARTRSDQGAPPVGPAPCARRGGGSMKIIKSSGNVFADLGLPGAEDRLLNGRLAGFSTERLLTWLIALGRDVDIIVRRPPQRRPGRLRVRSVASR